jgi:hypothetical protein
MNLHNRIKWLESQITRRPRDEEPDLTPEQFDEIIGNYLLERDQPGGRARCRNGSRLVRNGH